MNLEFFTGLASSATRWLLEPALRGIVLGGVTGLALWIFRTRNTLTQLAMWTVVLYAALALPLMSWMAPPLTVRLPVLPAQSKLENNHDGVLAAQGSDSTQQIRISYATSVIGSKHLAEPATPSLEKQKFIRWSTLLVLAYLLGFVGLAIRLAISIVFAQRLRSTAIPVESSCMTELIERSASKLALRSTPEILESSSVHVPLTIGIIRPAIVIPSDWHDWTEEMLRAVMLHELSHVQRRDPLTHTLAVAHRCAFWFSPFAWWLERHLTELAEGASDQAAINAGLEPTHYAEILMSFFTAIKNGQRRVNIQGVWMAGAGRAEQRIERVLSYDPLKPSKTKRSVMVAATAGALFVVSLLAAVRPKFVMAAPQASIPAQPPAPAIGLVVPPGVPSAVTLIAPIGAPAPPQILSLSPPLPGMQPEVPRAPMLGADGDLILAGVQIHGSRRISADTIRASIRSRVGKVLDETSLQQDFNSLWNTNNFEDIRFEKEQLEKGIILHVYVTERANIGISANDSAEGMHFVIVSGQSMTMSGKGEDVETVELLKKKIASDFIWFKRDGKGYVIRDTGTIRAAKTLYEPMLELGERQKVLGEKQNELGKQLQELGKRIEAVRVNIPTDLVQRLQAVEAKIGALGGSADADQLSRLQSELGNLQGQLGMLQGKAGQTQSVLGEQQSELGKQQSLIGHEREFLEKKQEEALREAMRQIQFFINKSLSDGIASPWSKLAVIHYVVWRSCWPSNRARLPGCTE